CQARIREMVGGETTVVIVSHNMNTVSSFCDRALCIHQGAVVAGPGPVKDAIAMYEGLLAEEE
ncbi:MAG: hypothetical protein VYB29_04600, partial [Candidatus Thermoplasmatota archaeon]|nr:hypothetical protein [Candidatus Thermoplasmatota archaeon]